MKTIIPDHNYDVGSYQANMPMIIPIIDAAIIIFSLFFAGLIYWQTNEGAILFKVRWWINVWLAGYIILSITTLCFYFLFSIYFKVYHGNLCDKIFSCTSPFLSSWTLTIFTLLLIAGGTQVTVHYSRIIVGSWMITVPILMFIWRFIYIYFLAERFERTRIKTRTVIIGLDESAVHVSAFLQDTSNLSIEIVGYYDDRPPESSRHTPLNIAYLGTLKQCIEDAKENKFDLAYLCMPISIQQRITAVLEALSDTTVSVFYILPQNLFFNALKPTWHSVAGYSAISVFESPHLGFNSTIKRAEDIILSLLILTLIAIPMLGIALLVKLSSPGPVLFKQRRYGLSGKQFQMLKFRSMRTTDDGDVIKQATKDDPRVTTIGKYLRKYSLDELPQFLNVLKGDMSIVGPRPHAVAHNEEYRQVIPGYMLRHKVKPGITGLAQVSGARGETETQEKMEDRVKYDLEYIQIWSLALDLKIILRTIFMGITGKNAY
ncbi:MAG: undecaprenyl-phosphate glucose phosphotransferase [Desulfobulbaceae bacterium]|nr:MAG: undecaprenyl-phosphate glucose phosphotransferase [Desulfobulbaceae bacterium]